MRTVVFLHGCPLSCAWCHNPESACARPRLGRLAERCCGCGSCAEACPRRALRPGAIDHEACSGCGVCVAACPAQALELAGRQVDLEGLLDEVSVGAGGWRATGGGLTLSGGEPLAQPDFACALAVGARRRGWGVWIESCLHASGASVARMRSAAGGWLVDWKHGDAVRHRQLTGVGHERILPNLLALHDAGAPLILRLPVIPDANDEDAHLASLAPLVARLPRLVRIDCLPWHDLGRDKAARFGLPPPGAGRAVPAASRHRWQEALATATCPVTWDGCHVG